MNTQRWRNAFPKCSFALSLPFQANRFPWNWPFKRAHVHSARPTALYLSYVSETPGHCLPWLSVCSRVTLEPWFRSGPTPHSSNGRRVNFEPHLEDLIVSISIHLDDSAASCELELGRGAVPPSEPAGFVVGPTLRAHSPAFIEWELTIWGRPRKSDEKNRRAWAAMCNMHVRVAAISCTN